MARYIVDANIRVDLGLLCNVDILSGGNKKNANHCPDFDMVRIRYKYITLNFTVIHDSNY